MIAAIVALATTLLLLLHLIGRRGVEDEFMEVAEPSKLTNGVSWYFTCWTSAIDQYGIPFGQYCISSLFALYRRMTVFKLVSYYRFYVTLEFVASCSDTSRSIKRGPS